MAKKLTVNKLKARDHARKGWNYLVTPVMSEDGPNFWNARTVELGDEINGLGEDPINAMKELRTLLRVVFKQILDNGETLPEPGNAV